MDTKIMKNLVEYLVDEIDEPDPKMMVCDSFKEIDHLKCAEDIR